MEEKTVRHKERFRDPNSGRRNGAGVEVLGGGCRAEEGRKERPTRCVSGRGQLETRGWLTTSALSEARIARFNESQSSILHPDWVWPLLAPWSLQGTPTSTLQESPI